MPLPDKQLATILRAKSNRTEIPCPCRVKKLVQSNIVVSQDNFECSHIGFFVWIFLYSISTIELPILTYSFMVQYRPKIN